jgi:hypothetical protein
MEKPTSKAHAIVLATIDEPGVVGMLACICEGLTSPVKWEREYAKKRVRELARKGGWSIASHSSESEE